MPRKLSSEAQLALHRANQEWHFKKRARQRLGLDLGEADIAEITRRIQADKPGVVFLALRRRSSAWRVKWRRMAMVVIYDHRTERLVTCYRWQKWKWE